MNIHLLIAIGTLSLLPGMAISEASSEPVSDPSLSSKQIQSLETLFAQWDRPQEPGCMVSIIRNRNVAYQRGYGSAQLDYTIPIHSRSVFYAASLSKQFVASCIAILATEGKLRLDDSIHKYIPELPPYPHQINIRHLIHHTSGLRDYLALMSLSGMRFEDIHTTEELLQLICRQDQLNFAPGEQYLYSNTGYFLLAEIIHRVSGLSLREFAKKNLFGPLGMTRTFFHDSRDQIIKDRVVSYSRNTKGTYRILHYMNWTQVGSGGLMTTAEDMRLWIQNFDDPIFGSPSWKNLMETQGVLNDGSHLSYGFGLQWGTYKGLKTMEHSGSFMGFRHNMMRFPEHGLTILLLANFQSFQPTPVAHQIADICLKAPINKQLITCAGSYHSPDLRVSYTIQVRGTDLYIHTADSAKLLQPTGPLGDYRFNENRLRFRYDATGQPSGFVLDSNRVLHLIFNKHLPSP